MGQDDAGVLLPGRHRGHFDLNISVIMAISRCGCPPAKWNLFVLVLVEGRPPDDVEAVATVAVHGEEGGGAVGKGEMARDEGHPGGEHVAE